MSDGTYLAASCPVTGFTDDERWDPEPTTAWTKQLIAVTVAHVTQCRYRIEGHTKAALRKGASEQELIEAIWAAAEMRTGGAYAHSMRAPHTADHADAHQAA